MPELPEVEMMARKLQGWAAGQTVKDYRVYRNPGGRYEPMGCRGVRLNNVFRRGKVLLFDFDNGITAQCHNAMSGFWDASDDPWVFDYVEGKRSSGESDVRLALELDSGRVLRFHDARLFGSFSTAPTCVVLGSLNKKFGPEAISTIRMLPGSPVLNVLDAAILFDSKKPVKQLLLEQQRLAGVGNIYASEALHLAGISPHRPGRSLSGDELQLLVESIKVVLMTALFRNLSYSGLEIYRRKQCGECEGPVTKEEVGGRSTYWCEKCQK